MFYYKCRDCCINQLLIFKLSPKEDNKYLLKMSINKEDQEQDDHQEELYLSLRLPSQDQKPERPQLLFLSWAIPVSKTNLNNLTIVKKEKTTSMEMSQATAMMIMSHCGIQDNDMINSTFMSLIEAENYNRKPSIRTPRTELQPFRIHITEKNISKMHSEDNIMAMFSNLEKLDTVSNTALKSLILVSAITLTKKKSARRTED